MAAQDEQLRLHEFYPLGDRLSLGRDPASEQGSWPPYLHEYVRMVPISPGLLSRVFQDAAVGIP